LFSSACCAFISTYIELRLVSSQLINDEPNLPGGRARIDDGGGLRVGASPCRQDDVAAGEKHGFPVKQMIAMTGKPERVVYEISKSAMRPRPPRVERKSGVQRRANENSSGGGEER